jgi:hypothetical protein
MVKENHMKLEDIFKEALIKFQKGVEEHGEFDPLSEKRKLLAEVDEEILDAINYLAMWLIQKRVKLEREKS